MSHSSVRLARRTATCLLIMLLIGSVMPAAVPRAAAAAPATADEFVKLAPTPRPHLVLGDQPYRFTGFNLYPAAYRFGATGCGTEVSVAQLGATLDRMGPGNSVLRFWAFQSIAFRNGAIDLSGIDEVVAAAKARGIRVIPVFGNQFLGCDGLAKTADWYGTWNADGSIAPGRYRTEIDPGGSETYYSWVRRLVDRYRDDPTVLAWELANEPEVNNGDCGTGGSQSAAILKAWAADVSSTVRSLDRNHLISIGTLGGNQCGMQGGYFASLHDLPNVDLCSVHRYPKPLTRDDPTGPEGLATRSAQCTADGKVLFLGEMGMSKEAFSIANRATRFNEELAAAFDQQAAGVLGWAMMPTPDTTFSIDDGDPAIPLFRTHGGGCSPGAGVQWLASPPTSLALNQLVDECRLRVVTERRGAILGATISTNMAAEGLATRNGQVSPGSILSGTKVDSFLLHADRSSGSTAPVPYFGSVTFDSDVLGVIFRTSTLDGSETGGGDLRALGTTYPQAGTSLRGLEFWDDPGQSPPPVEGAGDWIQWSGRTISFRFLVTNRFDEVRVITRSAGDPDVALTGRASSDVTPLGDRITWTFRAENVGTATARNASIVATVPNGAGADTGGACSLSGTRLVCPLRDLVPGAVDTVAISVTTTTAGAQTAIATVTASDDVNQTNDTASITSSVCRASDVLGTEGPASGYGSGGRWNMFGDGSAADHTNDLASVAPGHMFFSATSGGQHVLGLKSNGDVWGWGDNSAGQYDRPLGGNTSVRRIATMTQAVRVDAGGLDSFAIRCDGTLWGWGSGTHTASGIPFGFGPAPVVQQLGNGTIPLPPVSKVSAGVFHALALGRDGRVWAWGHNANGALGQGTTLDTESLAVLVALPGPAVDLSASRYSSLAVLADGRVFTWGADDLGQLGDLGVSVNGRGTPLEVGGLPPIVGADLGDDSVAAISATGDVWVWGDAVSATGSGAGIVGPTRIVGPAGVRDALAVNGGTAAIDSDGHLWTWGSITGRGGPGTPTMMAGVVDAHELEGTDLALFISSPDVTPPTGSISLRGVVSANPLGVARTTDVDVLVSASDDTGSVASVRLANDPTIGNGGQFATGTTYPMAATLPWSLPPNDGAKIVYAQFKDYAGNWSSPANASILLDSTAPTGRLLFPTLIPAGALDCFITCATDATSLNLDVTASDAGSGMAELRVSNGASTDPATGILTTGVTYSARASIAAWALDNPDGDGQKTVFAQWRDIAGNWSVPLAKTVVLDRVAPTATLPVAAFSLGRGLNSGFTNAAIDLTWSGSDGGSGSGIVRYFVEHRLGTGAFAADATLTAPGIPTPPRIVGRATAIGGKAHTFRVQASDAVAPASNTSPFATGPAFTVTLLDDASSSASYKGGWSKVAVSGAFGGGVHRSSTAGATVTFTAQGMAVGLIAQAGAGAGVVRITVDGAAPITINLADAGSGRVFVFEAHSLNPAIKNHQVAVAVVSGTVAVDALATMK